MTVTQTVVPEKEPPKTIPQHSNFIEAFAAAQLEFTPVKKSRKAKIRTKNKQGEWAGEYSYMYADLGDCLGMAVPILAWHGIAVSQPLRMVTTPKGEELRVVTELYWQNAEAPAMKSYGLSIDEELDPQDFGAVMSYWRRYDLCSLCGIAPEEDIDGRTSTGETRADRQARANEQPSAVKEFKGKALDQKRGQSDTGPFLRFNLHNEEAMFVSFNENSFDLIETEGVMLIGSAEVKRDSKGIIWYKVTRIEAEAKPLPPPTATGSHPTEAPQLFPEPEKREKPKTIAQSLNGLFTGINATKHKRLIETLITKHPINLQVDIAANFAARVKRESTTSEAGLLTALDIAVQEVTDDAALAASEQGGHDDELGF